MGPFNALTPVFLIIAVGAGLQASGFLNGEFHKGLNKLTYWVALPCLLFAKTASSSILLGPAARLCGVLTAGTLVCGVAGYLIGLLLRLPPPSHAAFVQVCYRGNLAHVGLPVLYYAGAMSHGDGTESLAVISLAVIVFLYNVLAVPVLLAGQTGRDRLDFSRVLGQLATNPLLISCVLGVASAHLELPVPTVIERACGAIGKMAFPLALIALGASLVSTGSRGAFGVSFIASLVKVMGAPAVGYVIATLCGLPPAEVRIAVVFLGCPTAVMAYVMAEQFRADARLSSSTVVQSSMLSYVTSSVILALLWPG